MAEQSDRCALRTTGTAPSISRRCRVAAAAFAASVTIIADLSSSSQRHRAHCLTAYAYATADMGHGQWG